MIRDTIVGIFLVIVFIISVAIIVNWTTNYKEERQNNQKVLCNENGLEYFGAIKPRCYETDNEFVIFYDIIKINKSYYIVR